MKDSVSVADIKRFGTPTIGDKRSDKAMEDDIIDRYIKICDMVTYFESGMPFSLTNRGDASEIFNIITAYLQGWITLLKYSVNIGEIPHDDLIALDALASKLYPYSTESQQVDGGSIWFGVDMKLVTNKQLLPSISGSQQYAYKSPLPEISKYIHDRRGAAAPRG